MLGDNAANAVTAIHYDLEWAGHDDVVEDVLLVVAENVELLAAAGARLQFVVTQTLVKRADLLAVKCFARHHDF